MGLLRGDLLVDSQYKGGQEVGHLDGLFGGAFIGTSSGDHELVHTPCVGDFPRLWGPLGHPHDINLVLLVLDGDSIRRRGGFFHASGTIGTTKVEASLFSELVGIMMWFVIHSLQDIP